MKFVIGRPICGISLNGFEYLMSVKNDYKKFDTSEDASKFLLEHGVPQECIDEGDYVITPIDDINLKSAA